jgi:hypothetical protein
MVSASASYSDTLLPPSTALQRPVKVRCTVQLAQPDGVVLWNLKRVAPHGSTALGHARPVAHGGVVRRDARKKPIGSGLALMSCGCDVDGDEALDEVRKHAQVSTNDEWICV